MGILKIMFKNPPPIYTILGTRSIAWRKFCSLFLNVVIREKEIETQSCPNSSFSHNFVTDYRLLYFCKIDRFQICDVIITIAT